MIFCDVPIPRKGSGINNNTYHFFGAESDVEMVDYVNRKLMHGRHRIWADVQSRIRIYILSSDLSNCKYDDFIAILDIVKRYITYNS